MIAVICRECVVLLIGVGVSLLASLFGNAGRDFGALVARSLQCGDVLCARDGLTLERSYSPRSWTSIGLGTCWGWRVTFVVAAWAKLPSGRTINTEPVGASSKKSAQRTAAERLVNLLVEEGVMRR